MRPARFSDLAIHCSGSKFGLHLINKGQAADRDRLGPAIVSGRYLARKSSRDPLAVCLLKIRHLLNAAQGA